MAIKRPTKSRGAPSHKPAAAAPLRHVDVKRAQQMAAGEIYVGWLCKSRSCGLPIGIVGATPGGKPAAELDDPLTAIACPHCGNEDLYRWSARAELQYTPRATGP
jgi:hypothetical protein